MTSDLSSRILDLLWGWWRELGVPGRIRLAGSDVLDVEWLLAHTPFLGRDDDRLLNLAHAWAWHHHEWVRSRRLEAVIERLDDEVRESFLAWRASLGDHVDWPGESTEAVEPAREVRMDLARPALAQLRARAIFGSDARADVLFAMLTEPERWHRAGSVPDIGTSRRNISRVLGELGDGRLLETRSVGRALEYRLHDAAALWRLLGSEGLRWVRWDATLGAMVSLRRVEAASQGPDALRRVRAHQAVDGLARAAALAGWSEPPRDVEDLSGVLRWGSEELRGLTQVPAGSLSEPWFEDQRKEADEGLGRMEPQPATMEVRCATSSSLDLEPAALLDAMRQAQIETFGWPIGVLIEHRPELAPKPLEDGIRAEVEIDRADRSFDSWACRTNGDRFLIKSIFEDQRDRDAIFVNTRIVRVAETFLHLARFYRAVGVPDNALVRVRITHEGFQGRRLSRPGRPALGGEARATADRSSTEVSCTLSELEQDTASLTRQVLEPLFALFDFASYDLDTYEDIVANFENGVVS